MDVLEAISKRNSVRGFKPDSVPRETVARILTAGTRAASAHNSQPWEIYAVSGSVLENLRWENIAQMEMKGTLNPDISFRRCEGKLRARQVDLAVRLFTLMGIKRGDRTAVAAWHERGYRFFDAPVGIILCAEKSFDKGDGQFTLGCMAANICLAALEFGLATCIHNQGVTYIEAVRKWVPIPESQRIAVAISLGYPDPDFPANRVETPRETLDEVVRWVGF